MKQAILELIGHWHDLLPYPGNTRDYMETLYDRIEKMDEWIPVTEKLPDTDEPVFTYCNGVPTIAKKTYSGEWVEAYDYEGLGNTVKFWMPLPPNN